MTRRLGRRRLRIPAVVQTSAMDCGPAALAALLAGFGITTAAGELRRACRVGVEGSSIDVLETLARRYGLDAEQVIVPADHVLLPAARCLPAIAVTLLDSGATHFVVLWRRWGPLIEIMDPAAGRRLLSPAALAAQLYRHRVTVPAAAWSAWARSEDFLAPLRVRAVALALLPSDLGPRLAAALADSGWQPLAAVDAALRRTAELHRHGLRRGPETRRAALALIDLYRRLGPAGGEGEQIVDPWTVRSVPALAATLLPAGAEPSLELRGALLIRVVGRAAPAASDSRSPRHTSSPSPGAPAAHRASAAGRRRATRPSGPFAFLLGLLPPRRLALLAAATALTAAAAVVEPLLLSAAAGAGTDTFGPSGAVLLVALLAFEAALLAVEAGTLAGLRSLGRVLEIRVRLAFTGSLAKLPDAFVRTRLASDLAERAHSLHRLRRLPALLAGLLRHAGELLLCAVALAWLAPGRAGLVLLFVLLLAALPVAVQPRSRELELRLRRRAAALAGSWLDLLRGAATVRACAAAPALAALFEARLNGRSRARRAQARAQLRLDLALQALTVALAAALFLGRDPAAAGAIDLLSAFWIFIVAALTPRLAAALTVQLPSYRGLARRLREPLAEAAALAAAASPLPEVTVSAAARVAAAPDRVGEPPEAGAAFPPADPPAADPPAPPSPPRGARPLAGVHLALSAVAVDVDGLPLLAALDLEIPAGAHLAVVGPSGAGKSTLLGLLLGWHPPAAGTLRIDGAT